MALLFLLSFSLTSLAHAKFTKYEVTDLKKEEYPLSKTCETMGIKHTILVEVVDTYTIDCMGTKINTTDFCNKISKNGPQLLRGFIKPDSKVVTCQMASRAIITVVCDERDKKYCYNETNGCKKIKQNYAANLLEVHRSITDGEGGTQQLNCYFTTKNSFDQTDDLVL